MNPFHAVPTIKHKQFCLAESGAILRYLAKIKFADAYPKDPKHRGFINWALDRFASTMYKDAAACIYPAIGFTSTFPDAAATQQCVERLEEFAKFFLKAKFIGGSKLSIADYKVAPFFFAYTHPAVQKKSKLACPERITQYVVDFLAECKTSDKLKSFDGVAVKELLDKAEDCKDELLKGVEGFKGAGESPWDVKTGEAPMEVYGSDASFNSLGPVMLMHDAKCGEFKNTNVMAGAHKTPEFVQMNPFHQIPTLKHGEYCLAESNAILRYIADCAKKEAYPDDAEKMATIDFAMDRFSLTMYA